MLRTVPCLTLACLLGSAMPAFCQPAPANDKIKLEVSRATIQIIGQGLMELPYKTAAPVMNDLQLQLNAAEAKAAADAKARAEEKPAEEPK